MNRRSVLAFLGAAVVAAEPASAQTGAGFFLSSDHMLVHADEVIE